MSSEQSASQNCIIIRQEVILPTGWGPLPITMPPAAQAVPPQPIPVVQAAPAISPLKPSPCGCGGEKKNTSAHIESLMRLNSIIIEPRIPGPGPDGCWPITDGKVTARGNASTNGAVGAIQICVKCFDDTLTAIPLQPESGSTCLPLLPTGQTYPISWEVTDVPVATLTGRNIIVVWFKFAGSSTPWALPQISDFIPCPPSGCGSGGGSAALKVSASPRQEVVPPRQFVAQIPGGGAPISLKYDEYCSSPEQPIWSSPAGSAPWTLKVCRYGDRLLGVLAERSSQARVWVSDDFDLASANVLICEGDKSSLVHIRPA